MENETKRMRVVLPNEGIITLQDLALYLGMGGPSLQKALEDLNVPILRLGKSYNHKLIRLSDLKSK